MMSNFDHTAAEEKLLGSWSAFENRRQIIPDGVLTMTFIPDGKLITVIRDGEEASVLNHEYAVSGDELILDGPKEYANPNHVRSKFWFDSAGNLVMQDRQGITSRYKPVQS